MRRPVEALVGLGPVAAPGEVVTSSRPAPTEAVFTALPAPGGASAGWGLRAGHAHPGAPPAGRSSQIRSDRLPQFPHWQNRAAMLPPLTRQARTGDCSQSTRAPSHLRPRVLLVLSNSGRRTPRSAHGASPAQCCPWVHPGTCAVLSGDRVRLGVTVPAAAGCPAGARRRSCPSQAAAGPLGAAQAPHPTSLSPSDRPFSLSSIVLMASKGRHVSRGPWTRVLEKLGADKGLRLKGERSGPGFAGAAPPQHRRWSRGAGQVPPAQALSPHAARH